MCPFGLRPAGPGPGPEGAHDLEHTAPSLPALQVVFIVDEDKYVKRFVLQQEEGRTEAAAQA